jgi:hypothetical protein
MTSSRKGSMIRTKKNRRLQKTLRYSVGGAKKKASSKKGASAAAAPAPAPAPAPVRPSAGDILAYHQQLAAAKGLNLCADDMIRYLKPHAKAADKLSDLLHEVQVRRALESVNTHLTAADVAAHTAARAHSASNLRDSELARNVLGRKPDVLSEPVSHSGNAKARPASPKKSDSP